MSLTRLSETPRGVRTSEGDVADKWIQQADIKKGALTAQAKHAKMGVQAFAKKHQHDAGVTGKRARLALTFAGLKRHNPHMAQIRHT